MSRTIIGKVAVTPKGEYASNVHYYRLDVVSSNGSSYLCLNECTGINVNNTEYWQMLVQKPVNGIDYNTQAEIEILKHDVIEQSKTDLASFFDEQEEDFEEILTNYSNGLKSDFDTNANNKTNTFNQNATTKTSDFNTNSEAKTTTFNNNATSKTSDFNTNAETKTTTFNNNASSKTTDFNNNASNKTDDFDSNASDKTDEFDEHVDDKIDEFDEHALSYGQKIQDLENNQPINTASGETIDLTDSAESYIRSIKLTGKTVQNGEPTPTNPVEIKNCTGSINEKFVNKNLLPNEVTSQTISGVTFTKNQDGTILANGTATSTIFLDILTDGNLPISTTGLILNGCPTGGTTSTYVIRANYVSGNFSNNTGTDIQLRSGEVLKSVTIRIGNTVSLNNLLFKPMLSYEGGEYEPHQEQLASVPLQENQNLMQNDYATDDGIHHVKGQVIMTGEETTINYVSSYKYYYISATGCKKGTTVIGNYISKKINNSDTLYVQTANSNNGIWLFDKEDFFGGSVANLKSWFAEKMQSGNPIRFEYDLIEETVEPYTPAQQTAYNQLKNMRTYKGETHIYSSDETPATVDLEYVQTIDIFKNQINDLVTRLEVLESEV